MLNPFTEDEDRKRAILAYAQASGFDPSLTGQTPGAAPMAPPAMPAYQPQPLPQLTPEQQAARQTSDASTLVDQATPVRNDASPAPDQSSPPVDQSSPPVDQSSPVVDQAKPIADVSTPPAPQAAQQQDPILSYLMAQQGNRQAPEGPTGHADVPKIEGPSQGGLAIAALLDAMLNRGRNVGSLIGAMAEGDKTPQQNAKLQMEADKNQAEVWHLTHPSAAGGADPMSQYIRLKQMEGLGEWRKYQEGAGKTRMEQGAKRLDQKDQAAQLAADKRDATKPGSQHMRDYFASHGVQVDPNMSEYDMQQLKPELAKQFGEAAGQQDAEARGAGKKAAAVAGATLGTKEELQENAAALREQGKEKQAAGAQYDEQIQNFNDTHPSLQVFNEGTYKSKLANTRSRTQMDKDVQTVDRAAAASTHLLDLAKQWSAAEMVTDLNKQKSLEQEYQLYKKEHVGIINQIEGVKGGGTQEARTDIEKELPERLNPFAVTRLEGVQRFVHSQGHETLRVYGLGVRGMGEPTPAQQTPKPAARPGARKPSAKTQDDPSDLAAELGM